MADLYKFFLYLAFDYTESQLISRKPDNLNLITKTWHVKKKNVREREKEREVYLPRFQDGISRQWWFRGLS